ncbi:oxygenase MpaB family protein [Gordonia zhaorongruii]|uniref:oxygenase MpaB family protein n=1 Tax=Gordonia zhaorongruii TaxID=2597659 RepID=UPI0010508C2F|nr:oxygenase MpaB family protein [Gordonia zhaorongruii]
MPDDDAATQVKPLPARHPDAPRSVPPGVAIFARAVGVRGPSDDEFRRIGEALHEGDPLMDGLVAWMAGVGIKETRPLFEEALEYGIANVPDAPEPLREFFAVVEDTPDWVDSEKLRIAAQTMNTGGADGLYIARDVALVGGYTYAGFNQTLLRTGALEKGSNKRFAETSQWAFDLISDGGLDKHGVGYRSTLRVRFIHSLVRRHVTAMPDWDADKWGLPINQADMAATIVGSLVAPSVGGLGMGLVSRPSEYEAIAHLTRYAGWLMGIDDEFLPRDFRESIRVLHHTSAALANPDETSPQLARPMATDPLGWNYSRWQPLRRRLAQSQHLSVSMFFLGGKTMTQLGLPSRTLPWYPILRTPVNLARSAAKLLPGGRERAAIRGRAQQMRFMRTMEAAPVTIGETTHLSQHAA